MKRIRIAIITQRDKFERYNDELKNEFSYVDVDVFVNNFLPYSVVAATAKKVERMGYDAIIARGFTYKQIKACVDIPIIVVEADLSDIICTIIESGIQKGEHVAILFYESNVLLKYHNLKTHLDRIFGIDTTIIPYSNMDEYDEIVKEVVKNGQTLITGYNGVAFCRKAGGRYGELFLGETAIRNGVLEAVRIVNIKRKAAFEGRKMQAVLKTSQEGIVYVNENNEIELINPVALRIFAEGAPERNLDEKEVEGTLISQYISNIDELLDLNEEITDVIGETFDKNKIILSTAKLVNVGYESGTIITFREIEQVVETEKRIREDLYAKGHFAKYTFDNIWGDSSEICRCKQLSKNYATFDDNVLIYGETGTGKELFAQAIHNESARRNQPFYAINCAAIPESLLESELFGYSEGSFTGAKKGGKAGIFELAHRGTIYLDEIGELPLASQSALLRVLQEKEVRRIGDDRIIPIDVRVIAASHKDILAEVAAKRFRMDLFYRLSVMYIKIPSLRERRSDIIQLVMHFILENSRCHKIPWNAHFTPAAKSFIESYQWPGNIRELQNFTKRIFALGYCDKVIDEEDVKTLLLNSKSVLCPFIDSGDEPVPLQGEGCRIAEDQLQLRIKRSFSKIDIERALAAAEGNKAEAARLLGISRTHLWRILNK